MVSDVDAPPLFDDDDALDSDEADDIPTESTVEELRAAVELADFLKRQPKRELLGTKLGLFYEWAPEHKETVKQAKFPGREIGVRSLCAMFPTISPCAKSRKTPAIFTTS